MEALFITHTYTLGPCPPLELGHSFPVIYRRGSESVYFHFE